MLARKPKFKFADMPMAWAPNAEFAQTMNAWGVGAPYVEPYLNKVMAEARRRLGPRDSALDREIAVFIEQESTHHRAHTLFNRELHRQGYGALKPLEHQLRIDFETLLETRSFAFNLAYCAGFETFTLYLCKFVFEQSDDLFEASDPRGADLWLWHLAEEFEHRSTCHAAFARLSGNYAMRLYGAAYASWHLGKFKAAAVKVVMDQHRANMTPAERASSEQREAAFNRRFNSFVLPRMLGVLMPYYDPEKIGPSPAVTHALARFAV